MGGFVVSGYSNYNEPAHAMPALPGVVPARRTVQGSQKIVQ